MIRGIPILVACLLCASVDAGAAPEPGQTPAPPPTLSSTSERIYDAARPRLLQVRTVLAAADRQSSLGSAFLVSDDGLAITNYHVVSQFALEPDTYRLDYTAADGRQGQLRLLAIDVADDLALVRVDQPQPAFFKFDETALAETVPKGETLYSMGNPLDLGFTIVEGTYNGPVDRSYQQRIHFSGAINPGMSGGPTVTEDGRVVGINVARQLGSELVSFLVPARFAAALIDKARQGDPPPPASFRAEIGRQLLAWQDGLYKGVAQAGFRTVAAGPYLAPESQAPWFTCWARTNENDVPKPRATDNATNCATGGGLLVANDLNTGGVYLTHAYLKSIDLTAAQFAMFEAQASEPIAIGPYGRKWHAHQECREDFVQAEPASAHPALRVTWCARAYRAFDGLYDVVIQAMTQDRTHDALVSRLNLQGISYDNALDVTKRFIDAIQWNP